MSRIVRERWRASKRDVEERRASEEDRRASKMYIKFMKDETKDARLCLLLSVVFVDHIDSSTADV